MIALRWFGPAHVADGRYCLAAVRLGASGGLGARALLLGLS